MSEKRFTVDDDGIYDNQEKKHFKFIAYDWIDCDIYECCEKLNEQQTTISKLAKKWGVLSQEIEQLKDYIDTIFEDNTHICKYLDIEDVEFYCDKNKDYRSPSCLYEKCFDEENLIKIKDEIRRVLE